MLLLLLPVVLLLLLPLLLLLLLPLLVATRLPYESYSSKTKITRYLRKISDPKRRLSPDSPVYTHW